MIMLTDAVLAYVISTGPLLSIPISSEVDLPAVPVTAGDFSEVRR